MNLFRAVGLVGLLASAAFAQAPPAPLPAKVPPDTLAARFAKTKRLVAKVTIDVKDMPPKDVFAQLSERLVDGKVGALVVVLAPGIALPPTLDITAKDDPLGTVLTKLLKPLGFGFVVVSKEDDPDDGRIRIVKYDPKAEPFVVKPVETGPPATAEDEKLAATKLETAAALESEKKLDRAKVLYKYIMKNYPGTKAAAEAKIRLEKLDP